MCFQQPGACGITAGAKLRRCVLRQDDVYDCCDFGATELLQIAPLVLLHPELQRAQLERLVRRARLRDAISESLEQAGVSDALPAVDRYRPII